MDRETYDGISKAKKVPPHCPCYQSDEAGCLRFKNTSPDTNAEALRILGDTDCFGGFCPEVLYHFFETKWYQSCPDHYTNCPSFSKRWLKQQAAAGRQSRGR